MTDAIDPADPHPGMMGDGTEEQNLGQTGHPEARIRDDEVQAAFGKPKTAPDADPVADLTDRFLDARDQLVQAVETAKDWTFEQAKVAREAAAHKPVLTVSASAGAALAIGLAIGFLLGRTLED